MATSVEVDFTRIEHILHGLSAAIDDGVDHAAKLILQLAKDLAPEETGALKESGLITGEVGTKRREVSFGEDLPDARAWANEFGTVYMSAQPFLFPAAKEIDIGTEVGKKIKDLFDGR